MNVEAGLPALALIFLLGMRHGLEPDHLAAVDGLTLRSQAAHARWTPWMGALFALGHGIYVLAIVAVAALASAQFTPSASLLGWLEWLPIALLMLIAGLNARSLLAGAQLAEVRGRLLPRSLPESWTAALGAAMVLLMAALYGWTLLGLRRVRA
jgi:high-affinity nickel-transport protein